MEQNISRAAEKMHLSQSAMSGALARLREYFEDDLLVQVGRRHERTPRAEALMEPVRDLLAQAEATVTTHSVFDAQRSQRLFRLLCSDYVTSILMPTFLELVWQQSKTIRFDLLPVISDPEALLARREVDLLMIPSAFMSQEHPHEELFRDGYSCIVWAGNSRIGEAIALNEFLSAGHAALQFGAERTPGFEGWFLKTSGLTRRIEVTTSSMLGLANLVIGTERIATVQTRLARAAAAVLPLRLLPPPLAIPEFIEVTQWHKVRAQDAGLIWLRGLLREAAGRLNQHAG